MSDGLDLAVVEAGLTQLRRFGFADIGRDAARAERGVNCGRRIVASNAVGERLDGLPVHRVAMGEQPRRGVEMPDSMVDEGL